MRQKCFLCLENQKTFCFYMFYLGKTFCFPRENFLFSPEKQIVFHWDTPCKLPIYNGFSVCLSVLEHREQSRECIVMYSWRAHYTLIKMLYINSLYAKMYRCIVKSKIFFEEINKSNLSFALRRTPVNFWPSVEDTHVLASLW